MMSRTESMSSSSTQQIKIKANETECPYCASLATATFAKGKQTSPFICTDQSCQAIEIGEMDEERDMSDREWETGWWEPMREPPEVRLNGVNSFFLEGIERDIFHNRNQFLMSEDSKPRSDIFDKIKHYDSKPPFTFLDSTREIRNGPYDQPCYNEPKSMQSYYNELKNMRYDAMRNRDAGTERQLDTTFFDYLLGKCDPSARKALTELLVSTFKSINTNPQQIDDYSLLHLIMYKAQEHIADRKKQASDARLSQRNWRSS